MALVTWLRADSTGSRGWKITSGFLWGLASLTRESGLLILLGLFLWLVYRRRSWRAGLRTWLPTGIVAVLVILPWTVRNYVVLERFVPIATNGGVNFYIGNNPEATGSFNWAMAPGAEWNKASATGFYETEASRLGYEHGLRFIVQNPGKEALLLAKKLWYVYKTPHGTIDFSESKAETVTKILWLAMYVGLFLACFIVAPFLFRKQAGALSLYYIAIAALTVPCLVAFGATRFLVSIIPFMALAGAVAVDRLAAACRRGGRPAG
jgi:hypothetical protein